MLRVKNILIQSRRFASTQKEASSRPITMQSLKAMIPSAVGYGSTLAMLGLYLTDWQLVLQFMPFYNGKFVKEE